MNAEHGENKIINLMLNKIQDRVQNVVQNIYYGQQPVSTCFLLETNIEKYKYLAYTPLISLPKNMIETPQMSTKHNPYFAFRAALIAILNHNKICSKDNNIKSVVCPFFFRDDLDIDINEAVRQMRLAYGMVDMKLSCNIENAQLIENFINL